MVVPVRSGARQTGCRAATFSRPIRSSGLKLWPSYVRPHCSQSPGSGSSSISDVTGDSRARRPERAAAPSAGTYWICLGPLSHRDDVAG